MSNIASLKGDSLIRKNKIHVLTTCFNEEEVIEEFIERICSINVISDLIIVDDGSRDKTVEIIKQYKHKLKNINTNINLTLIELSRNFGKEAAILSGLDYSKEKCDALIMIDCDLQDPPELIPKMIKSWDNGAEIVTAIRDGREKETFFKSYTARWFYKIFNNMVDSIQLKEGAGDYRLLSMEVITSLTQMRESSRFIKALIP